VGWKEGKEMRTKTGGGGNTSQRSGRYGGGAPREYRADYKSTKKTGPGKTSDPCKEGDAHGRGAQRGKKSGRLDDRNSAFFMNLAEEKEEQRSQVEYESIRLDDS